MVAGLGLLLHYGGRMPRLARRTDIGSPNGAEAFHCGDDGWILHSRDRYRWQTRRHRVRTLENHLARGLVHLPRNLRNHLRDSGLRPEQMAGSVHSEGDRRREKLTPTKQLHAVQFKIEPLFLYNILKFKKQFLLQRDTLKATELLLFEYVYDFRLDQR